MSETVLPAAAASTVPSPTYTSDAIKQAVEQLRDALPKVQEVNPAYGNALSNFLQRIDDPVRLNQAEVQHRIAYAVRDVAQLTGSFGQFDDTSAKLLLSLSISAPGLRNENVTRLLEEVASSSDALLRNDTRRTAIEIGKQTDQATPQIQSQVEVLENRVRLSQSVQPSRSRLPHRFRVRRLQLRHHPAWTHLDNLRVSFPRQARSSRSGRSTNLR